MKFLNFTWKMLLCNISLFHWVKNSCLISILKLWLDFPNLSTCKKATYIKYSELYYRKEFAFHLLTFIVLNLLLFPALCNDVPFYETKHLKFSMTVSRRRNDSCVAYWLPLSYVSLKQLPVGLFKHYRFL